MKNRDVLLQKAALVSILLLVAGLSAQSQSPSVKIWPMANSWTESKQYLEPAR